MSENRKNQAVVTGLAVLMMILGFGANFALADDGDSIVFDESEVEAVSADESVKIVIGSDFTPDTPELDTSVGKVLDVLKSADRGSSAANRERARFSNRTVGRHKTQSNVGQSVAIDGSVALNSQNLGSIEKKHVVNAQLESAATGQSGHIDGKAVSAVISKQLGGVKACYSSALKTAPHLSGNIYMQFTIGSDGRVSGVERAGGNIDDHKLSSCIAQRMKSWKFPAPTNGAVTIKYPFIFERAAF